MVYRDISLKETFMKQRALQEPDALPLPVLAERTGIPYETLRSAVRQGRLQHWKLGGAYLSSLEFVHEAMAAGTLRPTRRRSQRE